MPRTDGSPAGIKRPNLNPARGFERTVALQITFDKRIGRAALAVHQWTSRELPKFHKY
jgi:hypothetical protein